MPLTVLHKTLLPNTNILMRLTAADTLFLDSRIRKAVTKGTGVNFILENISGAACLIETAERGMQLSINGYSNALSYHVTSQMKGYNGPWSHIEMVLPWLEGRLSFQKFVNEI